MQWGLCATGIGGSDVEQPTDELSQLKAQVHLLQERVRSLRASRRVLISLLTVLEREKGERVRHLERENLKLQQRSQRWASALLEGNIRIVRMQQRQASSQASEA